MRYGFHVPPSSLHDPKWAGGEVGEQHGQASRALLVHRVAGSPLELQSLSPSHRPTEIVPLFCDRPCWDQISDVGSRIRRESCDERVGRPDWKR
jgi:hypothetical protein